MNRYIETKLPIRQVLDKIVEVKRRLAGSQSKTHEEKGRLLDSVSKAVHEVLYTATRHSGDPDSDDDEDPVTGGPDFEALVTDLHQSGRQARRNTQTHSNSNFQGALQEVTASIVRLTIRRQANLIHHRTCPMSNNQLYHHHHHPRSIRLERLLAASFALSNINGSQYLIVDLGLSTVRVEPATKHTIKVYKLHFDGLIKMETASTRAERIAIRMYLFPSSKNS